MSLENLPDPAKYEGKFFAIHAMPRTASTSVRVWLNRQDDVICHGEILAKNNLFGTSHKIERRLTLDQRNQSPDLFLKSYFLEPTTNLVGVKALSSHFLQRENMPFLKWFFATRPKIIGLYRTDLVARFKSTMFHRLNANNFKPERIMRIGIDDVLLNCIQTQEQWNIANNVWIADLNNCFIDIKDLGGDTRGKLEGLLNVEIKGDLAEANRESSKNAKTDHPNEVAHLEQVCSAKILDPFRNIEPNIP